MKLLSRFFILAVMFTMPIQAMAEDEPKAPSADQVKASEVVGAILRQAAENDDAVLYMAAGKLYGTMGNITLAKVDATGEDKSDANVWSATSIYAKVIDIAGANSDLGKMAAELAAASKSVQNSEGCYGYTHWHWYWAYDYYGYRYKYWYRHYC